MAAYKQLLLNLIGDSASDTIPTASSYTNYIRIDTDTGKLWRSNGTTWVKIGNMAYSDLTLTNSIVNADINSSAAIADSKLAQITDKAKLHSDIFYRSTYGKLRDILSPIHSTRKYGSLLGIVASPMTGIGATCTAATGQGSATPNISTAQGRYITHATGTTVGNNAGGHVTNIFQRAHNPYWVFKGKLVSTTNLRTFFGVYNDSANSPGASDTYSDSKSVAMIGSRSTDTNFQFIHNDGSATALYTDTGIAVNNTVRTWEIIGDDSNSRWGWTVDGGSINWVTTQVPASTTSLGIVHEIQCNDSGVAKSFDLINVYVEFDSK